MSGNSQASDEVRRVHSALGLSGRELDSLVRLATIGPLPEQFRLPARIVAEQALSELGVTAADQAEIAAARPQPGVNPELWWLMERCSHYLISNLGRPGPPSPPWPSLAVLGPTGRFAYVWVLLAVLPAVRRYHARHQVSDEVSWDSLGVLASQLTNHRAIYGYGGLHTQDWMTHHFRGVVYSLGRLHFERLVVPSGASPSAGGPQPGDPVLGLHIPEGRLTPAAVDESLARATTFFERHLSAEKYRYAVCDSWVLDPQLREYLPADSNIIRFQQRFALRPIAPDVDDSATVVEFLFKRPLAELDSLPRATTLQRAVIDHVRARRGWQFRAGWFPLAVTP